VTISQQECFDATQTITVAGNGTSFTIQNTGVVTMIAGENIIYYPGVTVDPGGYLYGYIAPQGPWCPGPAKPVTVTGLQASAAIPVNTFFRVYPNPSNGEFTVELASAVQPGNWFLEIFNMQGVQIHTGMLVDVRSARISLEGSPEGIYLVRAGNGTVSGTSRIVLLP
jgi:hypothetical protein